MGSKTRNFGVGGRNCALSAAIEQGVHARSAAGGRNQRGSPLSGPIQLPLRWYVRSRIGPERAPARGRFLTEAEGRMEAGRFVRVEHAPDPTRRTPEWPAAARPARSRISNRSHRALRETRSSRPPSLSAATSAARYVSIAARSILAQ